MNHSNRKTSIQGNYGFSHPASKQLNLSHECNSGVHKPLTHEDYTIGWVCALPIELDAAKAMLDHEHQSLPKKPGDSNTYTLGNIGPHNIAIACLPQGHYGTVNAAIVARDMSRSFLSINTRFMVGIGGGAPGEVDIRLGDIVVGSAVLQYDFGKTVQEGRFYATSYPIRPPQDIMKAVSTLEAHMQSQLNHLPAILVDCLTRRPKSSAYPIHTQDRLFLSTYEHTIQSDSRAHCDQSKIKKRPARTNNHPQVHYGMIASGNQVVKHALLRDKWAKSDNVVCFEMEAAGLADHFQCLVVRGICDYSDSHKNKAWQPYAATTAAAYVKALLSIIRPKRISVSRINSDGFDIPRRQPEFGDEPTDHLSLLQSVSPAMTRDAGRRS